MRASRLLVLGTVVALTACQDVTEPKQPVEYQSAMVPQQPGDEQSALARAVPEFGGFFFDEGGRPTAYLTDPGQDRALRARIGMLSAMRGHSPDELVILRGDFPYAQLEGAFDRATHAAFALRGTVFTDLDERKNRVVVGVEGEGLVNGARGALARAGLNGGSYEVVVTEPIYQLATLQNEFNPTVGGIQIHFTSYLCTLGANVKDGNDRSFVTNSHCTAKQGGVENTTYYQPLSSTNPQVIATEAEDPNYYTSGGCPSGRVCRRSDSSRALYAAGQESTLGSIALTNRANSGSLVQTGFAILGAEGTAAVGAVVNKVGRTTGWTQGKVSQTCVNTGVSGTTIVQLCQTWVKGNRKLVGGGDSGSAVWSGNPGNATLVGLLGGGSTNGRTFIFSPWSAVEEELGGDLTTF